MSSFIDEDNQVNLITRVADVKVNPLLKPALPAALARRTLLAALLTLALLAVEVEGTLSIASSTSLG
jgi:hypothetical protein